MTNRQRKWKKTAYGEREVIVEGCARKLRGNIIVGKDETKTSGNHCPWYPSWTRVIKFERFKARQPTTHYPKM